MTPRLTVVAAGCLLGAVALTARQQTPTFRAGVDIVTIDATVLDGQGRPIPGLGASDFSVTVDGRPRQVVSVAFVATQPAETARPVTETRASALPPAPSSNRDLPLGRSFMFLIDTDEIRRGEGQVAMAKIATFVDGLGPNDRVGLVSLPTGTPRVDLTDDRAPVKAALGKIAGMSTRMRECAPTMGEVAGITLGDDAAAGAYSGRVRGLGCPPPPPPPPPGERDVIDEHPPVLFSTAQYRMQTRARLDTAMALANAMAAIDGPKTLIFVAQGGLLVDMDVLGEMDRFGRALERARVTFFAIQLSTPLDDIGVRGNTITTGRLDERYGFEGLADAALAGGGRALKSAGDPTLALQRIDREVSGYYLLAVARTIDDKESDRLRLNVRVSRPGAEVRIREFVTIEPPAAATPTAPPADVRAAVGELLRSPVPAAGLGIDVDVFSSPPADAGGPSAVILVTEVTTAGRPVRAIGYEIVNESGKTVEDDLAAPPAGLTLPGDRYAYLVQLNLAPGRYRLRLGAIDDAGMRGSLEHPFVVGETPAGDLRIGDLILGDDSSGALRPTSHVSAGLRRLVMRLDIEGPASAFGDVRARFRLRHLGADAPAGQDTLLALRDAGRPTRRTVATAIEVAGLPSGPYEALVTVVTPKGQATVSRRFTVPATAR